MDPNRMYPARTIVMAFTGRGMCPSYLQTVISLAVSLNVSLYAAAGNDPSASAQDHFPANCLGVTSVGALSSSGSLASYSSRDASVNMPGGTLEDPVPCLGPTMKVVGCVGTSMSVPHAAGLRAVAMTNKNWMDPTTLPASLTEEQLALSYLPHATYEKIDAVRASNLPGCSSPSVLYADGFCGIRMNTSSDLRTIWQMGYPVVELQPGTYSDATRHCSLAANVNTTNNFRATHFFAILAGSVIFNCRPVFVSAGFSMSFSNITWSSAQYTEVGATCTGAGATLSLNNFVFQNPGGVCCAGGHSSQRGVVVSSGCAFVTSGYLRFTHGGAWQQSFLELNNIDTSRSIMKADLIEMSPSGEYGMMLAISWPTKQTTEWVWNMTTLKINGVGGNGGQRVDLTNARISFKSLQVSTGGGGLSLANSDVVILENFQRTNIFHTFSFAASLNSASTLAIADTGFLEFTGGFNRITINGGKVYIKCNSTIVRGGTQIFSLVQNGGYLEWSGSHALLSGNSWTDSGGVFLVETSGILNITGSNITFQRNAATGANGGGGAISARSSASMYLSGSQVSFLGNYATGTNGGGGAISAMSSASVYLSGSDISFISNYVTSASGNGGGSILADRALLSITGTNVLFQDNSASVQLLWYSFDSGLLESFANRSSLTMVNSGTTVDNVNYIRGSGSLGFTASSQYVNMSLGINPYALMISNGITISLWYRMSTSSGSNARIWDIADGIYGSSPTNFMMIARGAASNNIVFSISGGSQYVTVTGTAVNNAFHHIVWTITTTGVWNIYLDNVRVVAGTITRLIPNAAWTRQTMGRSSFVADGSFIGNIDDFRMFARVLTIAEVSSLFTIVDANTLYSATTLFSATTSSNGGAIYVASGTLIMNASNTTFLQNYAEDYGGAIYVAATQSQLTRSSVTISNCTFKENSASSGGAAISSEKFSPITTLSSCTFVDNCARLPANKYAISMGFFPKNNSISQLNILGSATSFVRTNGNTASNCPYIKASWQTYIEDLTLDANDIMIPNSICQEGQQQCRFQNFYSGSTPFSEEPYIVNNSLNLGTVINNPIDTLGNMQDSAIYILQPGVYFNGACQLAFTASAQFANVTIMGSTNNPNDTIINCSASTFFATVGDGFTLNLDNVYIIRGTATNTPAISISGTLFMENVTIGGVGGLMSVSAYANGGNLGNSIISGTSSAQYSFVSAGVINSITFTEDTLVDILIVGGGGSGASRYGGGGGAGSLIYLQNYTMAAGTYSVNVGAGGASVTASAGSWGLNGNSGRDSYIARNGVDVLRAKGGGGGTSCLSAVGCSAGLQGGSSGGSSAYISSTSMNPTIFNVPGGVYGNNGGSGSNPNLFSNATASFAGGGGGGAGSMGGSATVLGSSTAGRGGSARTLSIIGSERAYAGGGGGGCAFEATAAGAGGSSTVSGITTVVGGAGSKGAVAATAGSVNTGSGGGGSGFTGTTNAASGAGGSGIVIIRYSFIQRTVGGTTRSLTSACSNTGLVCAGTTASCTLSGTNTFESITACMAANGGAICAHTSASLLVQGNLTLRNIASAYAIRMEIGARNMVFNLQNFVAEEVYGGVVTILNGAGGSGMVNFSVANSTNIQGILSNSYIFSSNGILSTQNVWFSFGGASTLIVNNQVLSVFYVNHAAAHALGLSPLSLVSTQLIDMSHNLLADNLIGLGTFGYMLVECPEANVTISNNTVTVTNRNLIGAQRINWLCRDLTMSKNDVTIAIINMNLGTNLQNSFTVTGNLRVEGRNRAWFMYIGNGGTQSSLLVTLNNAYFDQLNHCVHFIVNSPSSICQLLITGTLQVTRISAGWAFSMQQNSATGPRPRMVISGTYTFSENTYALMWAGDNSDIIFERTSSGTIENNIVSSAAVSYFISTTPTATLQVNGNNLVVRNNTHHAGTATSIFRYTIGQNPAANASCFAFSGLVYAETTFSAATVSLINVDGSAGNFTLQGNDFVVRGFNRDVLYVALTGTARLNNGTFNGYFEISNRILGSGPAIFLSQTAAVPQNVALRLSGFYNFTNNVALTNPLMNIASSNVNVQLTGMGGIIRNNRATGTGTQVLINVASGSTLLFSKTDIVAVGYDIPTSRSATHVFSNNSATFMTTSLANTVTFHHNGSTTCTELQSNQLSSTTTSGSVCIAQTPAPTPPPTPSPTSSPTPQPTPSLTSTSEPTPSPTVQPTPAPTAQPTPEPTPSPTAAPTPSPTAQPTPSPTAAPTPSPTAQPTPSPTAAPTPSPTAQPTPSPTAAPTPSPTAQPTPSPTAQPTPSPTAQPTPSPTAQPTPSPTAQPTPEPTPPPLICTPCNEGYYMVSNCSTEADTICQPIIPGNTQCTLCSACLASYSMVHACNSTSNTYCSQIQLGNTQCTSCTPGFFASQYGSRQCTSCPPGTFTNITGSSACSACPPGHFSSTYNSTACQACSPGYASSIQQVT
jgi:predicted outer membrane repeat protein